MIFFAKIFDTACPSEICLPEVNSKSGPTNNNAITIGQRFAADQWLHQRLRVAGIEGNELSLSTAACAIDDDISLNTVPIARSSKGYVKNERSRMGRDYGDERALMMG